MILTQQNVLKDLITVIAAKPNSNLEWILERRDQFSVGEIQRDENGYFAPVKDSFLEREINVYIPEDSLRKAEFTDDLEHANAVYNHKITMQKNHKIQKWNNRKKTAGKFTVALVSGLIALAGAEYSRREYNKPERVVARQEAKKVQERQDLFKRSAVSIASTLNNIEGIYVKNIELYNTSSGMIKIGLAASGESSQRLYLEINNSVRFLSESWGEGFDSPKDDAENLESLYLKEGDNWIQVSDIPQSRRKQYQETILEIAKIKDNARN